MQSTLTNRDQDQPTTPSQRAARAALFAAPLLGLAAERLITHGPTGPGWVIWMTLFGAAAIFVVHRGGYPWLRHTIFAAALAVASALIFWLRASDGLYPLAMLVIIVAASLPMLRARGFRFGHTRLVVQLLAIAGVVAHAMAGVLLLLGRDIGRAGVPGLHTRSRFATAIRGALLALPLLLVFGALFIAADPLFERYTRSITRFITEDFLGRVFVAALMAWITAGLLRGLLAQKSPLELVPQAPALPAAEISIALGAVAALFTLFIAVQARWLFDGAGALAATPGLTAADYARRGFSELVMAAALILPLLLVADSVTQNAATNERRIVRLLSALMVALVLLVMGSALQRMALYTERFGLTEARIFATAFMAWLGVVFAWFVATTLRGRRDHFAAGPVAAGIAAVFVLAVINPDAWIARVNLDRARAGAEVDAPYLARLSADAAPALIDGIDVLPAGSRCAVSTRLLSYATSPAPPWQAANIAVMKARGLAQHHATELTRIKTEECPVDAAQTGSGAQ